MRKQSVGQPTGEQRVQVAWESREKAIVPSVNDKPGVTHNSNEWVGNYFPNLVIAITTDQAVFPSEFLRRTTAQDRNGTTEEIKNAQGSTRHTQGIQDEGSYKGSRPDPAN